MLDVLEKVAAQQEHTTLSKADKLVMTTAHGFAHGLTHAIFLCVRSDPAATWMNTITPGDLKVLSKSWLKYCSALNAARQHMALFRYQCRNVVTRGSIVVHDAFSQASMSHGSFRSIQWQRPLLCTIRGT